MPRLRESELTQQTDRREAAFVTLSDANYTAFPGIKAAIEKHGESALKKLYAHIASDATASALLPDDTIRNRAAKAQFLHWQKLFASRFDDATIARSEHIGRVHADVGLTPSYYIGGYALVLEELITRMLTKSVVQRLSGRKIAAMVSTLVKTALLDMEAALSAYFKAEEQDRRDVIASIGTAMASLSQGDFRASLDGLPQVYGQISSDFHTMRHQVSQMVHDMMVSAENIDSGAREISTAANDLASRTERQAATVSRTAEVMRDVAQAVETTAANAKHVKESITDVDSQAREGNQVVRDAIDGMKKIKTSSEEIAKITEVIESVAFQIDLLALNASIEAAHAGDAGNGFEVVAGEVRRLAERTTQAAQNIKQLVDRAGGEVQDGVDLVVRTGEALERITQKVGQATHQATEIVTYAEAQAQGLQRVTTDVSEMDLNTQQNAAMVEQSNAAAQALSEQASIMAGIVGKFQLERRDRPRGAKGDRADGAPLAPAREADESVRTIH